MNIRIIEMTSEEINKEELISDGVRMVANMSGSHVFAAKESSVVYGVAVISALTYGRGYVLNYITAKGWDEVRIYDMLLEAVEVFCEERECDELKCGFFDHHGDSPELQQALEQREYISIAKDGYYLAYRLDMVKEHELYKAVADGRMKTLLKNVRSYRELSADELGDFMDRIGAVYSSEDIDEKDHIYSRYYVAEGKTIGYLDFREIDPGVVMLQDVFRDAHDEKYVMPALLAGVLQAMDASPYDNPGLLFPIMFPGMYNGVKKALGEPMLEFRFQTYIKNIVPPAEDIEENGQFRLVMVQEPETYACFAPLFAEGLNYWNSDYIVIGAVDTETNAPAGVVVLTSEQKDIVIEYLFVEEKYRGQTVGTLLFEEIKRLAQSQAVPMGIECSFDMDNNDLLRFFFERDDIVLSKHGETFVLTPEDMANSEFMKRLASQRVSGKTSVADVMQSEEYISELLVEASHEGKVNDFKGMDIDLSQISIANGKVKAAVVMKNTDAEYVDISYVICTNDSYRPELFSLMAHAYAVYRDICPSKKLRMRIVNHVIELKKLFPKIKSSGGICVARWNYND